MPSSCGTCMGFTPCPFSLVSTNIRGQAGSAVLIEDTAVYFNALNGLPGPYIKSFLTSLGSEKLHLVLAGFSDKTAEAVSTIAYCSGPGCDPVLFQGRIRGAIVPARGKLEYGWQACFEDLDSGKTLAEMTDGEKHEMSHLRKALQQFITWHSQGTKDGSD
ncbi:Maf/Ham1 [Sarocladium strictum]